MAIVNDDQCIIAKLYKDKKYDEVILAASSLFIEQKVPLDVKQKIGLSYFYKGDYKNSLIIFEDIASKKNDVESWFNVLMSLMSSNKLQQAKGIFNKILKMHRGLKSQQPRELTIPFIRYYYACGLSDAGFYNDALEQIEELKKIYIELKTTDDTFLYIRGVPFLSQTLELANKVFIGLGRDFEKFLSVLRSNVDNDGKKLISKYSTIFDEKDEGILHVVNKNLQAPKRLMNQIIITNLILGVLAIAMIALIIVLIFVNPANKTMSYLTPAIISCSVILLVCLGLIVYFIALRKIKPIKEHKTEGVHLIDQIEADEAAKACGMTRKRKGKAKFVYDGSKNEFIKNVQSQIDLYNAEQKTDFITEIKDGDLSIGIGRTGHGGGLWYEPTIIENDNSLIIDGAINDVSFHNYHVKRWQNIIMWIFVFIPLYIGLSPFFLFRLIFSPFISTPKKQLKKFMVKYMNCTEI